MNRRLQSLDRSRRARRGFTLLEMLIVIFIILALGGIVLVNLLGTQETAENKMERIQINGFKSALDEFRLEMRRYPSEEEGLAVLWDKSRLSDESLAANWRAFLAEPKPKDSWGSEWIYRAPSQIVEGAAYDIISLGPDKQEGSEDDISNHDGKTAADGSAVGEDFSDFGPGAAGKGG